MEAVTQLWRCPFRRLGGSGQASGAIGSLLGAFKQQVRPYYARGLLTPELGIAGFCTSERSLHCVNWYSYCCSIDKRFSSCWKLFCGVAQTGQDYNGDAQQTNMLSSLAHKVTGVNIPPSVLGKLAEAQLRGAL